MCSDSNSLFILEDDLRRAYAARYTLAQYFLSTGDRWLSDHLFQTCLSVASQEPGGEQRLCEALRFVGLALEENGEWRQLSIKHLQSHWLRGFTGVALYNIACCSSVNTKYRCFLYIYTIYTSSYHKVNIVNVVNLPLCSCLLSSFAPNCEIPRTGINSACEGHSIHQDQLLFTQRDLKHKSPSFTTLWFIYLHG